MNSRFSYFNMLVLIAILAVAGLWLGGCAPITLSNFQKEGMKAYEMINYAAALEQWQAGLARARELEDSHSIAQFLYNIGLVHDKQTHYQEALEAYQDALKIFRERKDFRREANTLNNIGIVYAKQSQYQEALQTFQQALSLRQTLGEKQGEGAALDNLGSIHYHLGQYARALELYQRALTMRRELDDKAGEGNTLHNLGGVYESQGQYQEALEAYQHALSIRQSLADLSGAGKTLNNIGVVYWKLGQDEQALNAYQQALTMKQETKDKAGEAATLNNIGVVLWGRGQYQEALNACRQSLAIRQEIGDKFGEGSTLNNIGKVYESQHQFQQALDVYQQALTIRRAIGDTRGEGYTLNNLGAIYLQLGQYQQAYQIFQAGADIHTRLGTKDGLWAAQRGLAAVEVQLQHPQAALQHYEHAVDTIEALRAGLAEKEYKLSFIQDKLYVYDELIDLLQTLHQSYPNEGYDRRALEIFERKQGRLFLEEIGKSGARLFAGLPPTLLDQEFELEQQLLQTHALLADERAKLLKEQNNKLLQSLEEREETLLTEQKTLQAQFQRDYPDYYALKYPQPVSVTELQQTVLQPGEIILIYGVMQHKTVVWCLQNSLHIYTLPAGAEELEQKVFEFRRTLEREWKEGWWKHGAGDRTQWLIIGRQQPKNEVEFGRIEDLHPTFAQISHDLYKLLLPEELHLLLQGKEYNTLHIVPTGPLYSLPFEALVTRLPRPLGEGWGEGEPHYLIEDFPINYLSSASLLKTLREARERRTMTAHYPLLAFADPAYKPISEKPTPGPSQEGKLPSPGPSQEGKLLSPGPSQEGKLPSPIPSQEGKLPTPGPSQEGNIQELRRQSVRSVLGDTFPELPETGEEARTIAELFQAPEESDPLQLREKASRTNVFGFNHDDRLDDYHYLVFAAHGVLPGEVDYVTQSALVLTDDFLTMADVFNLRLNARLVSLSACNTGRGTHVQGEGVMGLTRAFMYSGTPAVAVTLWSVESLSAKALDVGFFHHLKDELPPARALQAIKLQMLSGEIGADYRHPYYWAPFVLFGDGR